MKTAVYPGTFDPITYGHIDVIKKSLNIFDKLILATSDNNDKDYYFSVDQRIDIINNSKNILGICLKYAADVYGYLCCIDISHR